MQLNWIDLVVLAISAYYLVDGWKHGFIPLLANLLSFLGSLWLAVHFHTPVGNFMVAKFGLTQTWSGVIGYLVVAIITQFILEEIFLYAFGFLPEKLKASKINRWLGSLISLINGLVIIAFVLLLILALPLRGSVHNDIRTSRLGSVLVRMAEQYGGSAASSVEDIGKQAIKFLTVEPGSNERIPLDIPSTITLTADAQAESRMVALVNSERTKRGIAPLSVDARMTTVAEGKSRDMFTRRYFSHTDPDGKNAADRMDKAGISYTVVGENLAYAPDTETAHEGLMNSEGHRENILDARFHRIGVGVINSSTYGMMFTQLFAD
jgi:uncharacterized protein YkwD/uncharacterized membrane protein required for colicin V production